MTAIDSQSGDSVDPKEPGSELEAAAKAEAWPEDDIERMAQMPDPVVVFHAATVDEGQIIRGLLESEGIPAIYNDLSVATLGEAMSASQDHAGDVLVAPSDVEQAKAFIESYQNATVTDDMVGEDASETEE